MESESTDVSLAQRSADESWNHIDGDKIMPSCEPTTDTRQKTVFPEQRSMSSLRTTFPDTPVRHERSSRASGRSRQSVTARRSILDKTIRSGSGNSDVTEIYPEKRSVSSQRVREDSQTRSHGNATVTVISEDRGVCESRLGVSVDESMSEFLSNVNTDNLFAFLNFYDKVTSDKSDSTCKANRVGRIREDRAEYLI